MNLNFSFCIFGNVKKDYIYQDMHGYHVGPKNDTEAWTPDQKGARKAFSPHLPMWPLTPKGKTQPMNLTNLRYYWHDWVPLALHCHHNLPTKRTKAATYQHKHPSFLCSLLLLHPMWTIPSINSTSSSLLTHL